jgi:hypothetical protein
MPKQKIAKAHPTVDPESYTPKQELREPNAKQKKSTARAQQNYHLSPPHQQKIAKAHQETSKAQLNPTRNSGLI